MTGPHPRAAGARGAGHPAVLDSRTRDLLLVGLAGLAVPTLVAFGVTVAFPHRSLPVVLAIIAGAVGVVALVTSSRLEISVTILAIYLALLNGPVKLGLGAHELTASVPNVLIGAVCLGAILRLLMRRERVRMPPLSAWVLAFVAVVVIEAFNPKTAGVLKVLGGFRQQLQFVPFFFFGYLLMRSKRRLRTFFVLAGVFAIANGAVAAYQTGLSPSALASWGPGYRALYQPKTVEGRTVTKHVQAGARTYSSEGESRARPVGLGSDSGFSGGVGAIALPCALALLATWPARKRWLAIVLALGSIMGIAMGLGRLQVIEGTVAAIAFVVFASVAGRVRRPLASLLTVIAIAIPFIAGFVALTRSGTFARYSTFESSSTAELVTHKEGAYSLIPHQLAVAPFGVGLGTVGPVGGFGGLVGNLVEGHTVSAETQYNLLADELGIPGLVLWVALSLYVIGLMAVGLRATRDDELTILLAAACAPFVALNVAGISGPFSASAAAGPYFWFAIGIAAYWFAEHKRIPSPALPGRSPA